MNSREALDLAGLAGSILLRNGAEIYRVQDTMLRIMRACGVENCNAYVLANGIFATVNEGKPDEGSFVRNIPLGSVHLGYINEVNTISREIEAKSISPETALERLEALNIPPERKLLQVVAAAVGGGAFCYLAGGTLWDSLGSLPIGVLVQLFILAVGANLRKQMTILIAALLMTLSADLFVFLLPFLHPEYIIMGGIVNLVEGVIFTNGVREYFNGDYLAGTTHLLDALLVGVCIACGVAAGLSLSSMIGGVF